MKALTNKTFVPIVINELLTKHENLQGQAIQSVREMVKKLRAVVWEEYVIGLARMRATIYITCFSDYTVPIC